MKKENQQSKLSIHCGSNTDSMEKLANLCEQEAEKLVKTLDIAEGDAISVIFSTIPGPGFPELICVGVFSRDESGKIVYELDFSESTL
jgi:hypothetical protein